jgi:hypothetical protein
MALNPVWACHERLDRIECFWRNRRGAEYGLANHVSKLQGDRVHIRVQALKRQPDLLLSSSYLASGLPED